MFSPITRLSGLLSVEVILEQRRIVEANASSTMFRGYEWIMRDHHVTDAVYLTERVCGICSLAHGAVASYLLDELYDNDISENAQYLRNIMLAADFLQNHIRHFYLFSLPDFAVMPNRPPYHGQDLADMRLSQTDNERLVSHSIEGIRAAQASHQLLALFGGKAPHQHSFIHGGVSVAPTADKIASALSLAREVEEFARTRMVPDTELVARAYGDYFQIGRTPGRFLSFGAWRFGEKNGKPLWPAGVLVDGRVSHPDVALVSEDVTHSWFSPENGGSAPGGELTPDPKKPGAYTWTKSVQYGGQHFEGGPLARMLMMGYYKGGATR
jgi:hydrogenase large subunit